jgi:ATP-dependent DNA helicase RecG
VGPAHEHVQLCALGDTALATVGDAADESGLKYVLSAVLPVLCANRYAPSVAAAMFAVLLQYRLLATAVWQGLIDYLKTLLPSNEEIGKAFRKEVPMYPELAIRELVANAIIHQDFGLSGTGPMIELFDNRLEITNPGVPLVDTQRFLDSPPQSRNEALASFMRRINVCEERGSGVDKVISQVEVYQLPAPIFEKTERHTRVVLFTYKDFKDMESEDRIRACYQHCCLKYVNRAPMNNTSLRERFRIDEGNSEMASRVIKQAVEAKLIRLYDPNANRKAYRYVPYWA